MVLSACAWEDRYDAQNKAMCIVRLLQVTHTLTDTTELTCHGKQVTVAGRALAAGFCPVHTLLSPLNGLLQVALLPLNACQTHVGIQVVRKI